eukprot:TRINITY_DN2367_c0_g1_i1.p1 TRINITY_DN2367_c0_g1~~TRINITY_DN2367_c0_g1_i1.p1  ORF type:complete len:267 (+),score=54.61 TRINITY_DN2367_c0_g1_i1:32-832(+)
MSDKSGEAPKINGEKKKPASDSDSDSDSSTSTSSSSSSESSTSSSDTAKPAAKPAPKNAAPVKRLVPAALKAGSQPAKPVAKPPAKPASSPKPPAARKPRTAVPGVKRKLAESSDDEEGETLIQRAIRLQQERLRQQAAAAAAEDPMAGYRPKRPALTRFPADIDAKIASVKNQITKLQAELKMKDDSKEVSLGTSKVNYIDPRVICAWAKRMDVPLEKIYNKSLLKKFPWARDIHADYRFTLAEDNPNAAANDDDDSSSSSSDSN